jgi:hypothetical protein
MKTGPDALGTAENESERQKPKREPTPSIPPKKSLGAQNLKVRNDSRSTKHENGTRHPRFCRKRVRARKT